MAMLDERPVAEDKCPICEHDEHERGKCTAHASALLKGSCDCWFDSPRKEPLA